jgi:hypothetical protein
VAAKKRSGPQAVRLREMRLMRASERSGVRRRRLRWKKAKSASGKIAPKRMRGARDELGGVMLERRFGWSLMVEDATPLAERLAVVGERVQR